MTRPQAKHSVPHNGPEARVVERLPGVDAGFLYMETPTLHMHTLKIALVDVTTVPGGYSFARFQ